MREDDIGPLERFTLALGNIRKERWWVFCLVGETRSATRDGDDRAVLVHFPVADLVEPIPTKEDIPTFSIFGDSDCFGQTVNQASANMRRNDVPCSSHVGRDHRLARATTVNGSATDSKGEWRARCNGFL